MVDGETGFVSKLGDIEKMSEDCIKLLLDNDLYLRIRNNCVKHSKKYATSEVVPQYIKIYKELLKMIKVGITGGIGVGKNIHM